MLSPENNIPAPIFSDIDLLTGCYNLVRFSKDIEDNFNNSQLLPITLITLDLSQLKTVNRERGFEHGDQLLRWLGILLRDEMDDPIYRISGQHFVIPVKGNTHETHAETAKQLFEYINAQATQFELSTPVVLISAIHFPEGAPLTTAWVWKNINENMDRVKKGKPFLCIEADPLSPRDKKSIRAIELMALRIVGLGQMMNVTFNNAYTDPVSNLPNVIAVQRKLELTLAEAKSFNGHFSLMLLDGDDLKRYNDVSYAAGDDLIKQISRTLKSVLREGDFIGRWRFGDEFVLLLPNTNLPEACQLANKIREAVHTSSQSWLFPTTISGGIVHYPTDGKTIEELIEKAQQVLSTAKAQGKDQILSLDRSSST